MYNKVKNLTLFIIYKFLLIYIYISYLSQAFHYKKYYTINFNLYKFLLFLIISSIFEIYLLKFKEKKFINIIIYILYLISYLPTMILFFMKNIEFKFFFLVNLYWIILFCTKNVVEKKVVLKVKYGFKIKKIVKCIKLFIVFSLYLVIINIIITNNIKINLKYFNLYNVYELRHNIQLSVFQNIILFCVGFTINPILSIKTFFNKQYLKFFFIIFFQVLTFFIAGHKTQLFLPLIGIAMSIFLKKLKNIQDIKNIFSIVLSISIFEKIFLKTTYILEFFIRRIWFIPALLNEYYLKFFELNKKLYFSEDLFLSRILIKLLKISQPYSTGSGLIIGKVFFNSKETSANTGLLAYGYAECGIFGIILYAILFIFLLKIFDTKLEKNKELLGILIVLIVVSSISIPINYLIYYILIPFMLMI